MLDGGLQRWLHGVAERSGIRGLVAHYHRHRQTGHGDGRWSRLLYRVRHSPSYPGVVGLLAVVSAATGLYPFAPVLIAAVVLAPERWRASYGASICGAALGAMLCAQVVQAIGSPLVAQLFPDIEQSRAWTRSAYWIGRHGSAALAIIAALPVPQMPALVVAALARLNPAVIGVAVFLGKAVKYGILVAAAQAVLRTIHRVAEKVESG